MMEIDVTITKHLKNDAESATRSMLKSGTGFMISLSDTIRELERQGYTENLAPANDQAILYAVRCDSRNLLGLYVDSYGLYHDDLTPELLKCFKDCPYRWRIESALSLRALIFKYLQ